MKIKILFAFFLSFISIVSVVSQSYAQTASSSARSYSIPNTESDVPQNLTTYSQSVVIELMGAVSCQLFGVNPSRPNAKCLGVNAETGKIGFVENGGGMVSVMSNMIGSMYYFPVGSGDYTQYLASNFIGNKETYAQLNFEEANQVGIQNEGGNFCYTDKDCAPQIEFCAPVDPQTNAGVCTLKPPYVPGSGTTPTPQPPTNGYGFGGLRPFLGIWTVFRNIAYLFYIAGFVFVGLGIVLRLPVDSRAVMSLQNQIPKIIISLILLTFSYAIAGVLIDVMYLLIFLVYNILSSSTTLANFDVAALNPRDLQGANPFSAMGGLIGIGEIANTSASSVGGMMGNLLSGAGGGVVSALIVGLITGVIGAAFGGWLGIFTGLAGAGVGLAGSGRIAEAAGYMIAFFVIGFALISSLFRIWFKLLSSYVLFLFTLVLGPFWIMGGIFPGMKFSFSAWLKTLIGHLSVFPTVVVMFMIGKVIISAVQSAGTDPIFVPPLIGNAGGLNAIAAIVGLGIILATPSIMDNVKNAFGTSGVPTQSIGQALGTGQQLGGTVVGGVKSAMWGQNRHGHATGILNGIVLPKFYAWRHAGGHDHEAPVGGIAQVFRAAGNWRRNRQEARTARRNPPVTPPEPTPEPRMGDNIPTPPDNTGPVT